MSAWTEAERALLVAAYTRGGINAARAALPHRTQGALFHAASRSGCRRQRRWTRADDAHLRDLWSQGLALAAISRALSRTRATTFWRAQKLGLTLGVPPDFEHVSTAARRAGFTTSQLRRILSWAGVRVRRSLSRPVKSRTGRRFHIVDSLDVDDALARWNATEPVAAAARRVGVTGDVLRARLRAIGVVSKARKVHLRVTDEQVRAALRSAS